MCPFMTEGHSVFRSGHSCVQDKINALFSLSFVLTFVMLYNLRVRKDAVFWLKIFNAVLLVTGWILAFYAYPRLPEVIPLWLKFSGEPTLLMDKSPLFFIYPASQTLFFFLFAWVALKLRGRKPEKKDDTAGEMVFLSLIFFNLIFIHLQRSIILLAHGIENGVDKLYLLSLIGILVLLVPFYRLRKKVLAQLKKIKEK